MKTLGHLFISLALVLKAMNISLGSGFPFQLWNKIPVNVVEMKKLNLAVVTSPGSVIECGAVALDVDRETIMCFMGDQCLVLTEVYYFRLMGPHTIGWTCFTTGLTSCVGPNDTVIEMYDIYETGPDCQVECKPSGLQGILATSPITCCGGGMTATGAGCVYNFTTTATFVGAKGSCRGEGMDLFSASSQASLDALLAVDSLKTTTFYVGYVRRVDDTWTWKNTIFERNLSSVAASAWDLNYPDSDPYWMCATAYNGSLRNSLCNNDYPVICHAPVDGC